MNIRAMQVFVELAGSASIRQAAQRLSLSPTAIARQIDVLEYYFHARLVDRGSGGIELTEAGRLLAERARSIVNDAETTRALIDDLRGLQRGQVTIRAAGSVVAGLLAPVLCELHVRHPGLRFHVDESRAGEILSAVSKGDADIGVTIFSPDSARSMISDSYVISHAVIVSPTHTLASLPSVSMKTLASQPIAMPDAAYGVRQSLQRNAKAAGVRLDPVFVTGSLEMQKELAARGTAVLILPPLCCRREIEAGVLVAIPLAPGSMISTSLDLYKAPDRTLSFAAQTVLDALIRTIKADLLPAF
jgi:DNA-binding transcriptional LysR family regulator